MQLMLVEDFQLDPFNTEIRCSKILCYVFLQCRCVGFLSMEVLLISVSSLLQLCSSGAALKALSKELCCTLLTFLFDTFSLLMMTTLWNSGKLLSQSCFLIIVHCILVCKNFHLCTSKLINCSELKVLNYNSQRTCNILFL